MASLERKSGYLLKQGHDQSTWRRRFCVCEDSRLVYYKKQPPVDREHHMRPLGTVPLHKCTVNPPSETPPRELSFILKLPERRYYFCAKSAAELDEWIGAIDHQRHKFGMRDVLRQLDVGLEKALSMLSAPSERSPSTDATASRDASTSGGSSSAKSSASTAKKRGGGGGRPASPTQAAAAEVAPEPPPPRR
jgi:hypothetical protein